MKVLNIDALVPDVTRTIKIKGVTHNVVEMTVENFIESTLHAERLEKDSASVVEQIEATAAAILRSVPTLDMETLRLIPLKQLGVIFQFIRGEDEFADKENAEKEGDSAKK